MDSVPQTRPFWRIAGKSDVGMMRRTNEDAFFCDFERGGFFAVADGVGGLEFGEKASAAAVDGVRRIFGRMDVPVRERPDFARIYREIDGEVDALGETLVPGFGIATTLDVAVAGGNGFVHFAHLGDSGIFLLRGNDLARLSEEHTLAAEERARGNKDYPAAYENTLTRVLGAGTVCEPQVFSLAVSAGDRILVATDGITRTVPFRKIERLVSARAGTPESIAAELIDAANTAGGGDNSTAVVAFIL